MYNLNPMVHLDRTQPGPIKYNAFYESFFYVHCKLQTIYSISFIFAIIEVIQIDKQNTIMKLLNSIYVERIQSQIKYDHLLSKLNRIEKAVNKIGVINNIPTLLPDFDSNFMSNWPMTNEQMFQNISKYWMIHLFH